jgi:hypothetical protein
MIVAYLSGPCRNQAELTFAMARHAVADLSIVFETPPCEPDEDRLPAADLDRLTTDLIRWGFNLSIDAATNEKLGNLGHMYEPYLNALANHLCLDIPPWIPAAGQADNWQTSAWDTRTLGTRIIRKGRSRRSHF